jgi:hypothetical protein
MKLCMTHASAVWLLATQYGTHLYCRNYRTTRSFCRIIFRTLDRLLVHKIKTLPIWYLSFIFGQIFKTSENLIHILFGWLFWNAWKTHFEENRKQNASSLKTFGKCLKIIIYHKTILKTASNTPFIFRWSWSMLSKKKHIYAFNLFMRAIVWTQGKKHLKDKLWHFVPNT